MSESESKNNYRVTFDGTITEEYSLAITRRRFAKYFKISQAKTKELFSGKQQVIKSNISEEIAMKLAMTIATIGCECVIEEMDDEEYILSQPGFIERRSNIERRVLDSRRKIVRGSSARPDRRQNEGRRKTDREEDISD